MDSEERLVLEAIVFKLLEQPIEVRTAELVKLKRDNPELAAAITCKLKENTRG